MQVADPARLIRGIALAVAIAFALPALSRFWKALTHGETASAFVMAVVLAALGWSAHWIWTSYQGW